MEILYLDNIKTILKGQFTPEIKSVRYSWDMGSNNYY